ncbi:MAG: hemolysin III family protein [Longimicrobiales bacterium]|nr:hemolysin III family protein [Longimicrobiales bacterium]
MDSFVFRLIIRFRTHPKRRGGGGHGQFPVECSRSTAGIDTPATHPWSHTARDHRNGAARPMPRSTSTPSSARCGAPFSASISSLPYLLRHRIRSPRLSRNAPLPRSAPPSRVAREELANALSHGVGLALAVAALPILVVNAASRGGAADVVGAAVFGASLVLLYLASTAYHAAPMGRTKALLRRLDHAAIYLLIAGTYTPFTLGVLGGAWGWSLFGVVWGAAVIGVATKLLAGIRFPRVSTAMYLVMGWMVVIAIHPLVTRIPGPGVAWLVAGGVLYSAGVAFYATRRLPYAHLIWHLFVLGGSICHFFAALGYAV